MPLKKRVPAQHDTSRADRPAPPRPNWPPFKRLVSPSDLSLQVRLPGQIITIPSFWPAKLCKDYVSFLSTLPLTTTPGKPKKGDAVRVNDRFEVEDAAFAERLWSETALRDLVLGHSVAEDAADGDGPSLNDEERVALWGDEVVGLNPRIRIYRYKKGQFFDKHYDDSNQVTIPGSPCIPAKTTWTFLLYLTSAATGCIGGETVFYPESPSGRKKKNEPQPEPVVVDLEVGMALLHRHGSECLLHEGREVLQGEKWVIRSDLCIRR
ncbi:uncharacterized protein EI97DRAFT_436366 [Westerdykella ornata]|uniref:Prolyl 4-hydroxylase alpha subunit domain-containing protein n=1 Tax=Westerdykella ornata TaxID=318751 RepID=A0A6A6J9R0_WESOR|nr:uncharacterized protein EI97DRAFT_436366 [Westerdykella ornata]KAF2273122.1 hypothetical protein EI97DRAFT_436366 [Westerdykella ornata]